MTFSQTYFGKPLNELSYDNIESFFLEEKVETNHIEFKSINQKEKIEAMLQPLRENICGFLNSDGGIIIWGAPEGKKVLTKKEKIFQCSLRPLNYLMEKDKLINKLCSEITPLPNTVKIQSLEKLNNYIYIIEVESSQYSPHQTSNHYFMRIDGQTRHAPHHYIEALFKKIRFPNIEGHIRLKTINNRGNTIYNGIKGNFYELHIGFMAFNWSVFQNEENVYARIISDIGQFQDSYGNMRMKYPSCGECTGEIAKILSYGEPMEFTERIFFNTNDFKESNLKSDFYFSIGGKYSPIKASYYQIDFERILNQKEVNINNCIIKKYSNVFLKDLDTETGNNRDEILKNLGMI
jgi:hypothetical protein